MSLSIEIQPADTRRQKLAFVRFPWQVYRDDPNWVPPLIADQLAMLDARKNPFFSIAEVGLFLARGNGKVLGTIATFTDPQPGEGKKSGKRGGFGFFEVLPEYEVAQRLLDHACQWSREHGITHLYGPMNFNQNENAGVLVEPADCPPVMLEAHTPLYYKDFLERYGMQKDDDLFAWRAFRAQIGEGLKNVPASLLRVAEAARKTTNVTIRKLNLDRWDEEVDIALDLFNRTLDHLPGFIPMRRSDFKKSVDRVRMLVDPDLALFAEVEGKPIGFCIAIPDPNRMLLHLNGRLFPFNWLKVRRLIREIDVVTFKLMGVLEEYRRRGIESLLYLEAMQAVHDKGYAWLDGSVTSERNPAVNLLASRWGAERYKHYRTFKLDL